MIQEFIAPESFFVFKADPAFVIITSLAFTEIML